MTVVGAIMAPRFGYLTPNFAFNPLISFQVVIMALLGGMQRLWGPVLGVVPLIVLSELLQVRFPFWYSVLLGLVFMVIVYFLPRGVTGLVEDAWERLRRPISLPRGITGPVIDAWTGCRGRSRCRAASPACSKTPGRGLFAAASGGR